MIDIQARQKLAQKQLRDDIAREIKNNVPHIPSFNTEPISQSIENTNGINEDQLTMSTLIYDKLDEISASLAQLNENLEKGQNAPKEDPS